MKLIEIAPPLKPSILSTRTMFKKQTSNVSIAFPTQSKGFVCDSFYIVVEKRATKNSFLFP